ncbi:MAG: flavin reductase [Ruminococcus sp.]|nr:flavin reductase [Ruminococcus sp.]
MAFKKIRRRELCFNPFDKIGKEWMLLTGGTPDDFNTMTASWGQLGVLWSRKVLTCYIRPNRYTYEYIDKGEYFTASFFGEQYRSALTFCGSHSGRDFDKVKETGLTPVEIDGNVAFEEADLVLVCRKLYQYDMEEKGFLTDDGIAEQVYGKEPYHRAYISEIVAAYVKE